MRLNDLTDKRFGLLVAVEYMGKSKWRCKCDCGNETEVFSGNLLKNHTTSCGCAKERDLSGMKFGKLIVIKKLEGKKRGGKKRTTWLCECTCEKKTIVEVYGDSLVSGIVTSCGCLRKEMGMPEEIKQLNVDGTQISKLMIGPTKANKSGVVGVNWDKSRNLWMAGIRFRGKRYYLGRFADFEIAVSVRKKAEEKMHGDFLKWYNQHQKEQEE